MKAVVRLVAIAVVLCGMPGLCASAQTGTAAASTGLAGVWKGSFEFQDATVPLTISLKTDGTAVSGTVEGLDPSPTDIHDGKLDGATLGFWLNTDYQGQTYKVVFKGKVAADHIDFDFGTDDGNWGTTMTATRVGAAAVKPQGADSATPLANTVDLTGAWKGTFEYNGNPMQLTFNLKGDGATVTGNVEGMGPAPVDIHDGKLTGDTVTFWLNADYQGQTYALTYTGKVANGQIDFNFGTADNSWTATVTVKKT